MTNVHVICWPRLNLKKRQFFLFMHIDVHILFNDANMVPNKQKRFIKVTDSFVYA